MIFCRRRNHKKLSNIWEPRLDKKTISLKTITSIVKTSLRLRRGSRRVGLLFRHRSSRQRNGLRRPLAGRPLLLPRRQKFHPIGLELIIYVRNAPRDFNEFPFVLIEKKYFVLEIVQLCRAFDEKSVERGGKKEDGDKVRDGPRRPLILSALAGCWCTRPLYLLADDGLVCPRRLSGIPSGVSKTPFLFPTPPPSLLLLLESNFFFVCLRSLNDTETILNGALVGSKDDGI